MRASALVVAVAIASVLLASHSVFPPKTLLFPLVPLLSLAQVLLVAVSLLLLALRLLLLLLVSVSVLVLELLLLVFPMILDKLRCLK